MTTRYVARWVVSDKMPDDNGDFDPAFLEWGESSWTTYAQADAIARMNAKLGPMPDHWEIERREWNADYYEPGAGAWELTRAWIEGTETRL